MAARDASNSSLSASLSSSSPSAPAPAASALGPQDLLLRTRAELVLRKLDEMRDQNRNHMIDAYNAELAYLDR